MATSKLNKLPYFLMILLLISCKKTAVKSYAKDDCDRYVASKQGFWIDVSSKSQDDVTFKFGGRTIIPKNRELTGSNINYLIDAELKVTDTLLIIQNKKAYRIYDFKNLKETATDGSNHKEIEICRVSTAKIDGKPIQDSRNNILKVTLN